MPADNVNLPFASTPTRALLAGLLDLGRWLIQLGFIVLGVGGIFLLIGTIAPNEVPQAGSAGAIIFRPGTAMLVLGVVLQTAVLLATLHHERKSVEAGLTDRDNDTA